MKSLIAICALFFMHTVLAQDLDWKLSSATVVESQDAMVRAAGLKQLVLNFRSPSCSPLSYIPEKVDLVPAGDGLFELDITPESRRSAARRAGIVFPACSESDLTATTIVKDGAYNIKVNGVQKGALTVSPQGVVVAK